MIKITNVEVLGWEHAIRGMRNPLNSWDKSDSLSPDDDIFYVGANDLALMQKLINAGNNHSKFRRMITVYADITAPLYWWKEYDTYKVGTVANSCSTMHTIQNKPIELSDFSIDNFSIDDEGIDLSDMFINVVADCEDLRKHFIETGDRKYWRGLIQLLPTSFNQKRTVQLNYQVLANIYQYRKAHKLLEWREFCEWIEELPYSLLITGGKNDE